MRALESSAPGSPRGRSTPACSGTTRLSHAGPARAAEQRPLDAARPDVCRHGSPARRRVGDRSRDLERGAPRGLGRASSSCRSPRRAFVAAAYSSTTRSCSCRPSGRRRRTPTASHPPTTSASPCRSTGGRLCHPVPRHVGSGCRARRPPHRGDLPGTRYAFRGPLRIVDRCAREGRRCVQVAPLDLLSASTREATRGAALELFTRSGRARLRSSFSPGSASSRRISLPTTALRGDTSTYRPAPRGRWGRKDDLAAAVDALPADALHLPGQEPRDVLAVVCASPAASHPERHDRREEVEASGGLRDTRPQISARASARSAARASRLPRREPAAANGPADPGGVTGPCRS